MILMIFAAWHAFASEALDIQMTPEEKKATGVNKLDDQQKAALQQWIDAHYTIKETPTADYSQTITGKNPTLSENLLNSRYLRLSDESTWAVRPEDVPLAQGWITPAEIIVTQSTDPFFTYKLTNKLTGSSILARKVDKIPQGGATPTPPES